MQVAYDSLNLSTANSAAGFEVDDLMIRKGRGSWYGRFMKILGVLVAVALVTGVLAGSLSHKRNGPAFEDTAIFVSGSGKGSKQNKPGGSEGTMPGKEGTMDSMSGSGKEGTMSSMSGKGSKTSKKTCTIGAYNSPGRLLTVDSQCAGNLDADTESVELARRRMLKRTDQSDGHDLSTCLQVVCGGAEMTATCVIEPPMYQNRPESCTVGINSPVGYAGWGDKTEISVDGRVILVESEFENTSSVTALVRQAPLSEDLLCGKGMRYSFVAQLFECPSELDKYLEIDGKPEFGTLFAMSTYGDTVVVTTEDIDITAFYKQPRQFSLDLSFIFRNTGVGGLYEKVAVLPSFINIPNETRCALDHYPICQAQLDTAKVAMSADGRTVAISTQLTFEPCNSTNSTNATSTECADIGEEGTITTAGGLDVYVDSGNNNWVHLQSILPPPVSIPLLYEWTWRPNGGSVFSTWGRDLGMSKDGKWLALGDDVPVSGGSLYIYRSPGFNQPFSLSQVIGSLWIDGTNPNGDSQVEHHWFNEDGTVLAVALGNLCPSTNSSRVLLFVRKPSSCGNSDEFVLHCDTLLDAPSLDSLSIAMTAPNKVRLLLGFDGWGVQLWDYQLNAACPTAFTLCILAAKTTESNDDMFEYNAMTPDGRFASLADEDMGHIQLVNLPPPPGLSLKQWFTSKHAAEGKESKNTDGVKNKEKKEKTLFTSKHAAEGKESKNTDGIKNREKTEKK